jgi:hypothetical protein
MWLILQGAYALVAWSIAVRAVVRVSDLVGALDPALMRRVRALVAEGRGTECGALADRLENPTISLLLKGEDDEDAYERLDDALAMSAPPTKALRGMATIGTSFGLLAAIATLRFGMPSGATRAAGAAFESALLGFVTAVPLWTAIGVCGLRMKRCAVLLEKLAAARTGEEPEPRGSTASGS